MVDLHFDQPGPWSYLKGTCTFCKTLWLFLVSYKNKNLGRKHWCNSFFFGQVGSHSLIVPRNCVHFRIFGGLLLATTDVFAWRSLDFSCPVREFVGWSWSSNRFSYSVVFTYTIFHFFAVTKSVFRQWKHRTKKSKIALLRKKRTIHINAPNDDGIRFRWLKSESILSRKRVVVLVDAV